MESDQSFRPIIVKVGGSLFNLPDLGARLERWVRGLDRSNIVLLPGGGPVADVVRDLDRCHSLGDERAHWLALHALSFNARFLAAVLPNAGLIEDLEVGTITSCQGKIPVLDPHTFAVHDEKRPEHLSHSWSVTSDSLAARVAVVSRASQLILLKSVTVPENLDWVEAGRSGFVDAHFAEAVGRALSVKVINFREWQPP